jgi:hypothetical protein
MVVDGKVLIGNEDGTLTMFAATKEGPTILGEFDTANYASIYSTPSIANGHMFLADRSRVYCIKLQ